MTWDETECTTLLWLRYGPMAGCCARLWTFWFHKIRRISFTEKLLTYWGLHYMGFLVFETVYVKKLATASSYGWVNITFTRWSTASLWFPRIPPQRYTDSHFHSVFTLGIWEVLNR
jgi:H+/Cl- antiporter ClcA